MASNASGNQSESAQTWDEVDSGMSDDVDNSLTGQGTADREMTKDADRDEAVEDEDGGDDPKVISVS
ncbi:hypothetical protein [Pseudolysinimonas sp.]|uniref:hypothetical protein n=1 Tax=Pseudolysinimonas sp. TaxID=2680009 RepID=UPI003F7EC916